MTTAKDLAISLSNKFLREGNYIAAGKSFEPITSGATPLSTDEVEDLDEFAKTYVPAVGRPRQKRKYTRRKLV